mmetsp:Transcript_16541/g.34117  ORF Transcript_16541/g.34117 Transcript_16541/m.34117 type:complete len:201 (+) Transcript_16541:1763-2365(+)
MNRRPDGTHLPEPLQLLALFGILELYSNGNGPIKELGDLFKIILDQPSRAQRRGSHSNSTRIQGRLVSRDSILVGCDACHFQNPFDAGSIDLARGLHIHQHKMIVGSATNKLIISLIQLIGESRSVLEDLILVLNKLLCVGLFEAGREGTNGVIVWSTLKSGKDSKVDLFFQIVHDGVSLLVGSLLPLSEENHRTTRTSE